MGKIFSITRWTIKQRKISCLWWLIGISSFITINMVFYPSFKNDAEQLQKSFENIPDAALQLMGGSADFFSPTGFLNSQIFFIMLPLLLGILAISLGSKLLATEEQDKTIEGLLARPVSRNAVVSGKALAGLLIMTVAALVSFISVALMANAVSLEISAVALFNVTFVCLLLCLSFGSFAYLLTASGRAKGASIGLATLFALGGYIVSSLSGTVQWLKVPSKAFPFSYYHPEPILLGTYNWANAVFFILVIVTCFTASLILFRRRDLI